MLVYPPLRKFIHQAQQEQAFISELRKELLGMLANYIQQDIEAGKCSNLLFICTHNSRRSHIAQLWAQALAAHFDIAVFSYSGGTEATAFNPRAVNAMVEVGFQITGDAGINNPVYEVKFSDEAPPIKAFSKLFDAPENPSHDFCAVMTCSHADENCPFIPGASRRIALTFDDPKDFDGTVMETEKYAERVHQIGRELVYAFSLVNTKK